jgi:hypothetical protein
MAIYGGRSGKFMQSSAAVPETPVIHARGFYRCVASHKEVRIDGARLSQHCGDEKQNHQIGPLHDIPVCFLMPVCPLNKQGQTVAEASISRIELQRDYAKWGIKIKTNS